MKVSDVAIIGCGIIGSATAFELSKYKLDIVVLESSNDVANGASKANSAVIHAGYDCKSGTLMAELNVKGSALYKKICKDLSVERRELPSLVLAFSDEDMKTVQQLYERGMTNGVPELKILSSDEVLKLEPNVNPEVVGALYAGSSAIINPWEMVIAFSETAVRNGVNICLDSEVLSIAEVREKGMFSYFEINCTSGRYYARHIINASGACGADVYSLFLKNYSERVNPLIQRHICGQYYVLDKDQGSLVNSVIFCCPDEKGKGVLVAPTVHGNLIVGPDSFDVEDAQSVGTAEPYLEQLKIRGHRSVPSINFKNIIHEYAGVRANTNLNDFYICSDKDNPCFINLIGMRSPGLSAAPAVAEKAVRILREAGLKLEKKEKCVLTRKRVVFRELSNKEKDRLIKKDPLYGQIVCRCENVTEGEIRDAIRRPVVPMSIDAIKRRTNAGMGRCQGSFCGPKVHEILARELGLKPEDILLDEKGTFILTGNVNEDNK